MTQTPDATLEQLYIARTPGSAGFAQEARTKMPGGISHDGWDMRPHQIYIDRADGARKWDVDGNEYVDYFGGHGSLVLGHNHPKVRAAIEAQLANSTHYGACHALGLRWAQLIIDMVPGAEKVRFTGSGTEATMMAVRIARAMTGRSKLLRFNGHFHGWNDHMTSGYNNHFDASPTVGVVAGIADELLLCDVNDEDALERMFQSHRDIAAVILEPTGSHYGRIPLCTSFLHSLRRFCEDSGTILIFDEVVTGFRVSPGGAQAVLGVTPDLTCFGKALGGGLPCGAVAGRAGLLDALDVAATSQSGTERVQHTGTFNANPLSAAAGVAALELIAGTDACARANAYGEKMRTGFRDVLAEERVHWPVYGDYSTFHVFPESTQSFEPEKAGDRIMNAAPRAEVTRRLRLGMLVHGVDMNGQIWGFTSAAHGDDELDKTVTAFAKTIRALKREGDITADIRSPASDQKEHTL